MQEPVDNLRFRTDAVTHDGVAAFRWSKEARNQYVASLLNAASLDTSLIGFLLLRAPNGHVSSLKLDAETVVGRGNDADIKLGHPEISRRHCKLTPRGEAAIAEDLGSLHGTLINGQPLLAPHLLATGDILTIGPWLLVWV